MQQSLFDLSTPPLQPPPRTTLSFPLRPYQREALDAIHAAYKGGITRPLVALPTGCHRAEQKILLYNGDLCAVEDIKIGMRLMGPDSRPRIILALAHGTGPMIEVCPVKGAPWVVNDHHILTLVRTAQYAVPKYRCQTGGGDICDIDIQAYQQKPKWFKHLHKLFHVGVDFPSLSTPLPIAPYILSLFLGDGTLAVEGRIEINKPDREITVALEEFAEIYSVTLKVDGMQHKLVRKKSTAQENPITHILRALKLTGIPCQQRFVPQQYKVASHQERLELLAGLIDTDGSLSRGCYDWLSKSPTLAKDMAFLARSVGLACTENTKYVNGNPYYRLYISGNVHLIPCRITRKKAPTRLQKKDALRTGFTLKPTDTIEPYYGFTLSGDGRYLLDDFTVTHNTGKTIVFSTLCTERPGRTLILVHRDELIHQTVHKLAQIAPHIPVGVVKAERNAHAVSCIVASVQTLSRENRLTQVVPDFSTIVCDEAHHCTSPSWRRILDYCGTFDENGPLTLGVTATPERSDKQTLKEVFQKIIYQKQLREMIQAGYLCNLRAIVVQLAIDLDHVKVQHGDFTDGDLGRTMLAANAPQHVLEAFTEHASNRKTLIFTPTVATAYAMQKAFAKAGYAAEALDGTTPTDIRHAILERFHTGQTQILSNCAVLCEGYDEPSVDCVVLCRPTKSRPFFQQMIGRGTRTFPGKTDCMVLDCIGVSQKHRLVTLEELLDLSDGALKNKNTKEAFITQERETAHQEQLLHEGKLVAHQVDLFAERSMNWVRTLRGNWILGLADYGTIRLEENGEHLDLWRVVRARPQMETEVLHKGLPLEYAQGFAEDLARQQEHGSTLVSKDARWRQQPMSDKQREVLTRWGVHIRQGMTKGEASDLMSAVLGDK